jgi:hypothetical protein
MSDASKPLEIPPIPSRESWQEYVKGVNRPGSRLYSDFIRPDSPMVDKLRVCEVIKAEVVAEGIPGHLIEKHLKSSQWER